MIFVLYRDGFGLRISFEDVKWAQNIYLIHNQKIKILVGINSKEFPNGVFLTILSGQCLLKKLGYGTNGLKDGDLTVGLTNIYK